MPQRELHVHSVPTRAERVRTFVEIAAIVAAGVWALYTFVYEQRIKPLGEQPSFSVPTTVDQGPTANGVTFLTIRKGLQNTGNVGIDIAAEALSVYGERLVKSNGKRSTVSATRASLSADVPRKPVTVLYSIAKLRSGAIGGDATSFYVPPHSSLEEEYLVAVPAHMYPAILVKRRDYVFKPPLRQKLPIQIVKSKLGGFDVQRKTGPFDLEYDSEYEVPIR